MLATGPRRVMSLEARSALTQPGYRGGAPGTAYTRRPIPAVSLAVYRLRPG